MKLIIDIPEEVKEAFDNADDINFCFYDYNSVIGKAIQNGTPLESIREEIEDYVCNKETDTVKAQGMLNALRIMEKHIGKGVNEWAL